MTWIHKTYVMMKKGGLSGKSRIEIGLFLRNGSATFAVSGITKKAYLESLLDLTGALRFSYSA